MAGACSEYNSVNSSKVNPGRVCVSTDQGSMDRTDAIAANISYTTNKPCDSSAGNYSL